MTAFAYQRDLDHPVSAEAEQTIRSVLEEHLSSQGLEGVWRGTYGPHRLEVVRLGAAESAVAATGASHPAPSPLPPPLPSCLDAV